MKRTKRGLDSSVLPLSTRNTDIRNYKLETINKHRKVRTKRNISNTDINTSYFLRDFSKEKSLPKYTENTRTSSEEIKQNQRGPSIQILLIENLQLKEKIKHLQSRIEVYEEKIREYYKLKTKKIPTPAAELESIPVTNISYSNNFMQNKKLVDIFMKETGIKFHYGKKEKFMLSNFIKKVRKEIPPKLKSIKEPEEFFIKYHVRTIKREKGHFTITPNLLCSNWAWNYTLTEMEKEKREHGKLFL